MNKSAPGHGDKLAKELGLDTSKANVVGGTGDDTFQSEEQPYVRPSAEIDNIDEAYRDLDYDPKGHGDLWNGVIGDYGEEAQKLSGEAEKATIKKYGINGGNDESDAFRHAYWSYTMSEKFGTKKAKVIGDGHEAKPKHNIQNDPINTYLNNIKRQHGVDLMDLHNNRVGRQLFEQHGKSGRPATEIISEAIRAGKLQLRPFKILRKK